MASPNREQIDYAYRATYGRNPNEAEYNRWIVTDLGNNQGSFVGQITSSIANDPEAVAYKTTGYVGGRENFAPGTQVDTTYNSRPAATVSPSGQPTPATPTASPYAVPNAPTYSTNYSPNVDQFGNVQPYVPGGITYSPTSGSSYAPVVAAAQGSAPVASIPPSGTASSAYGNIPMSMSGMPTINLPGENGVPTFTFDFAKEQGLAYEKLKPFYQKILAFAGGNVDLAKRILEYSYQQGTREALQEYTQATGEQSILFPQEQRSQLTTQNRRGILTSGFGQTEQAELKKSQGLRREAVERALQNRESRLTSERGFGLEKEQRGFEETKFNTERDQRKEASELAQNKFGIQQTQYQALLDRAAREEQRRIANEQNNLQKSIYRQQGYTV